MEFLFDTVDHLGSALWVLAVAMGALEGVVVAIFRDDCERIGRVRFMPSRVHEKAPASELLALAMDELTSNGRLEQTLAAEDRLLTVPLASQPGAEKDLR